MRKHRSSYNGEKKITYPISTTNLPSVQGRTEEGFAVEKKEGLTLDSIFFTECSSLFNNKQGKEPGINLLYSSMLTSPVTDFNYSRILILKHPRVDFWHLISL